MLKIANLICAFTLCTTMLLSQTQLVLQKGMSGVVMQDAFVKSDMPTTNYGDAFAITLHANVTGSTSPIIRRSYLKWNLSSIPNNAIILSASLELYATTAGGQSTSLERVENSWVETGITWNNAPDGITTDMITTTATMSGSWETFDITPFVQNWVNYPNNNHGVRVRMASEAGTLPCKGCPPVVRGSSYRSSKYTTIGSPNYQFRPKLIVEYVLPIEIELISTTHCTTTSSTDGSITVSASEGDGTYTYQWFNSSGGTIGTNSPTISGLGYGWYGVKVTDGLGNESYMSFIVGVECETVSISYNPGPNYVDDAYISNFRSTNSDLRDVNFGSASIISVYRRYSSTGYVGYFNYKGLLRFRISLDEMFKLNKADLVLFNNSNSGTTNNPVLRLTSQDWRENTVTFNHQPNHNSSISQNTNIQSTGSKIIDTKAFWQHWQNNSNFGFFIDLDNPNLNAVRQVSLRSTDLNPDPSIRPRMEFEVSLKCAEPATLKEKIDGGTYYLYRPFLRFHFDEYQDAETNEKLKLEIRNNSNQIIASSAHSGNFSGIPLAPIHLTHGNFHSLDLSNVNLINGQTYTLIVETILGKKLYLNFTKVN